MNEELEYRQISVLYEFKHLSSSSTLQLHNSTTTAPCFLRVDDLIPEIAQVAEWWKEVTGLKEIVLITGLSRRSLILSQRK